MDGWWLQTAEFLRPLHELAIRVVLASHVVHTDDTSVRVRDAWRKEKHTGRFWPYVGDELHALTVFDYTPTHQREGPAAFLKDYRGYLQADAFNGYDGIYLASQGRIIEVACWAHARRKFHECRRLDAARMETALAWIGKLYAVEKDLRERCQNEWKSLALEERAGWIARERQERSRPLLADFHAWLEAEAPKVLPKSDVRGAMDYSLNNWAALCVYTEDGWLDIDNNEGENSLRGLYLGRKNWLFLGSDRGGCAAAIAAVARQRYISACWPPASDTATIPRLTIATFSFACRRCCPRPPRKNFSPYFPTAGSPLEAAPPRLPPAATPPPTCSAGRLRSPGPRPTYTAICVVPRQAQLRDSLGQFTRSSAKRSSSLSATAVFLAKNQSASEPPVRLSAKLSLEMVDELSFGSTLTPVVPAASFCVRVVKSFPPVQ
jgi:hypothetical protein